MSLLQSTKPLPDELLKSPLLWRLGERPRLLTPGIPSGFAELDRELPEHGWPRAGLTELLCDAAGLGEVSLLLPAMAHAQVQSLLPTAQQQVQNLLPAAQQVQSLLPKAQQVHGKGVVWIAPPYLPYAPALAAAGVDSRKLLIVRPAVMADTLWAAEQAMRAGAAALVVAWFNQHVEYALLRRLQLACASAECAGFIYRASNAARQASPAVLRLLLASSSEQGRLELRVFKRRGMQASQPLSLATTTVSTTSLRGTQQSRFTLHEIAAS